MVTIQRLECVLHQHVQFIASCFPLLSVQTPLLYASKHNHHLMVADLIYLGANVNETNNAGKSCLHLSAESGYIRVLEVRAVIISACIEKEPDCVTVRLLLGFCFCVPSFCTVYKQVKKLYKLLSETRLRKQL